ncbi:uncharacterized protein TRIVIDRAFT_196254 [Trichoderma virens Gv29-8]|uniref:V-type ATPase, C subunit family protein n=1 Tax=Hypocrea virens (strain Gv29-8 / FGSC 10586) TaxID=413071 RepID=G9NCH2_HYPVG|nr:uncharacterized protein TRIVIDRAFT_196254 [Trichoderma virens Gv29-8]EHK15396.1 hypothetical protein TRIVIDRAFT_196254 [Trichoderma virens Gv29-8]UKZ51337.1 hypothetical protein TrVGV298_005096 [Trichoderma virens]
MIIRPSQQALRSLLSRRGASFLRRSYSNVSGNSQTRFTYALPADTKVNYGELFEQLRGKKALENADGHNAAVLLTTPDFAKDLEDANIMGEFARLMAGSADVGRFHVLSAVVDHLAGPIGSLRPFQGVSVLRGHLNDMLPQLWQQSPPKSKDDADSVSALTFSLGDPALTLPLARTTFHNNRASTLLSSEFDLTRSTTHLARQTEKHSQFVRVALDDDLESLAHLDMWTPLMPLTQPRTVTESFGNIIRGIEVDGTTIPASTELEDIVNALHKQNTQSGVLSGPVGVWAMVIPNPETSGALEDWLEEAPEPISVLPDVDDIRDTVKATGQHLKKLYSHGGRLYKILSGGGGWGAKKGLLSLDPQRTHFSLSEEEEMQNFIQSMSGGGFTPQGSQIQFFMSAPALPDITEPFVPGVAFGVSGDVAVPRDPEPIQGFIGQHFGALSNSAIYLSGQGLPSGKETKLSVPHSRVYGREPETKPVILSNSCIYHLSSS